LIGNNVTTGTGVSFPELLASSPVILREGVSSI
jgi:hypothetical protein